MDASLQRQWQRYNFSFVLCLVLAIFLAGMATAFSIDNKTGYSSDTPMLVQYVPAIQVKQDSAHGGAQVARMPQQQIEAPVSRPEPPQLIRAVGTHHPSKSHAYRAYVVKPGETLSRLDPAGWKHTCDINRQFGSIKKADCTLAANAAILLPVAVVESMTLAAVDSPAAPSERIAQTEIRKRLSQTDRLHLAEKARWQFCDHTGNERSSACESERAANFEMLVLSLQRSSDRT